MLPLAVREVVTKHPGQQIPHQEWRRVLPSKMMVITIRQNMNISYVLHL